MATLTCHNCGHGNSTEATFCAKCITSLRRPQLARSHRTKTFVPPQISMEVGRQKTPPPKSSSGMGWLLGMMIVIGGLIIWWFNQ